MFAVGGDAKAAPVASATDAVNQMLRATATANEIPMAVSTYALPDAVRSAEGQSPDQRRESTEMRRREAADRWIRHLRRDRRNAGISVEQATLGPARQHPDSPLCYLAAAIVPPGDYTLRLAAADADLRRVRWSIRSRRDRPRTRTQNRRSRRRRSVLERAERPRPTVSAGLTDTLLASVDIVSDLPDCRPGCDCVRVSATPTGPLW